MATVALSALRAEIAARDPNRWPSDSPPSSDDDDFSVASSSRPLPPAETLYQNTMRHFSPRRGDGRFKSNMK